VKEIKKEKTMRLCGLCSRELLTPFPAGMGGGGIERERQNLKQAPRLRAEPEDARLPPTTLRSRPEQKFKSQKLNELSHPGTRQVFLLVHNVLKDIFNEI